jgi:hypothetical protein
MSIEGKKKGPQFFSSVSLTRRASSNLINWLLPFPCGKPREKPKTITTQLLQLVEASSKALLIISIM